MAGDIPTISIPRLLSPNAVAGFWNETQRVRDTGSNQIQLGFSDLASIRPVGVMLLNNLILFLRDIGMEVTFTALPKNRARDTLDNLDFFHLHANRRLGAQSEMFPNSLPLRHIRFSESHHAIENQIRPWLQEKLKIPEQAVDGLSASLKELFNNIHDHSGKDVGSFLLQHIEPDAQIRIVVADFGVGIPQSVRKVAPDISDSDAVKLAFTKGFTSGSTPRNAGIGLDYLLTAIVRTSGGTVTAYTSKTIMGFEDSAEGLRSSSRGVNGFFPGTAFEIVLKTDRLVGLGPDEDELIW